ncbi:MAG: hypothetical protein LAO05_04160 [Acidobacteriia bacterium]|nr:hypothetical protein [Terriglobia bacterium]
MRTGFKAPQVVFTLLVVGLLALGAASVAASTTALNHGTQSAVAASTTNTAATPRNLPAPDGLAGPGIQITGVTACGCAIDTTSLAVSFSNLPATTVEHTLVIVNGVVYMDQLGSFLSGSGVGSWGLFFVNDGGTATGTWPLPSGQPIHVTITLVDQFHRVIGGWEVILDGCGNCNIVTSQALQGEAGAIPTAGFFGLAVLAALLLIAGVFIILRLRA